MPLALAIAFQLIGLIPEIPALYDNVKNLIAMFEASGHISPDEAAKAHAAADAIQTKLLADLKAKGAL